MLRRLLTFAIIYLPFVAIAAGQDYTSLGGSMTSFLPGPAAIQVFAPNVTNTDLQAVQLSGFAPFHRHMTAADGLGPRFVNSSCGGCHVDNGRGRISFRHSIVSGSGSLVVKVKTKKPSDSLQLGPVLQNHSINRKKFYNLRLKWQFIERAYPDGTKYKLRKPILTFSLDGISHRKVVHSLRTTPAIIGPGLMEAVSAATIEAAADPFDADGDGISGVVNYVTDLRTGSSALGRFGFKSIQPSVEQQTASALANEMGMSNFLFPVEATEDISEDEINRLVVYQILAGVPAARNQLTPQVESGKSLFFAIGCEDCHTSAITTGDSQFTETSQQTIHPFSDFLLHDMGPGLADKLSEGFAKGSEWRTTPLWGLGFSENLSTVRATFLHDGRARTIEEAILWHEGEAKASRDKFMALKKSERQSLIAFLRSL